MWKKKFKISKPLLTFRIAHFFWYGAGSLSTTFLSIFITQRGLTLVELSSVFAMIFVFQFLCCSVTGVLTDKIGNAKPVLMLLMFSTSFVLVSMCLTPNINSTSCSLQEKNVNKSDQLEYTSNFSSCYANCLIKNKKYLQHFENFRPNSTIENVSSIKIFDLEVNNNKTLCNFTYIPTTNFSFQLSSANCCDACVSNARADCVSERNIYLVVVYAILILAFFSVSNAAFRFTDLTSISLGEKSDSHYGKEVAVAMCGSALFTIIIAFVLNADSSSESKINYDPVIWFTAGLMFCAFLALCITKVPIFPPGRNLLKNAFSLVRDVDILVFILLVFVAGNGYAFIITFRLVFFKTINAPSILVALHSVAMILYAFPVLLTSKWWLKKFGSNTLFVLCLLLYTVDCAAYSYMFNPWWSLIIDITKAFTSNLFWVAVVMHCWNMAPLGFGATLNAVTGAVHFGIGRSSGVFFGGMLMNYMGPRKAYRIMSALFFVTAVLYSIFLYVRLRSSPTVDTVNAKENTDKNISTNESIQDERMKTTESIKICE